jgi:hypothetical protein
LARSNTGATAKPSAGSVKAAAAIAPAPFAVAFMNRRRVIVSPSKAPGICASSVYRGRRRRRRSG